MSHNIFADLEELVLPEDPLLDPENELIEMPSDPRYMINATMNAFADTVAKVGPCNLL